MFDKKKYFIPETCAF